MLATESTYSERLVRVLRRWTMQAGAKSLHVCASSALACGAAACSAVDDGSEPSRMSSPEWEGPPFSEPAQNPDATNTGQGNDDFAGFDTKEPSPAPIGVEDACVIDAAEAELVTQPVDIILVLDNSGSMHEEMGAVERNINQNFAAILTTGGVDYRVILLSRHRRDPRTTGETQANTSVCVTAPLSGLASCPGPEPVFTDRFIQYGKKIESFDAMNWLLDAYGTPPDDDNFAEQIEALGSPLLMSPMGYGAFLRDGAKKVVLVLTDDNEGNAGDTNPLTIPQLLQGLAALSTGHFGTPETPAFTFHSIIGLKAKPDRTAAYLPGEPIQTEKCTARDTTIPDVGTFYQELSIRTNGLRFPICEYDAYDAVFRSLAQNVVVNNIACDFPIPPAPSGSALSLDNVAIQYSPGKGLGAVSFRQAPTLTDCQADAFYITNDRLTLCPATCSAVRANPTASMTVLFTCESQLIQPR